MSAGKYWLGQSAWSAARLRMQYELTKTNFDGHILDPSIPTPTESLMVADIATGTGVWALDFNDRYPGNTIEGLDINLNEVPPQSWLPSNVTFRKLNVLHDLPQEYVGRYDIIHMQYTVIFVRDADVAPLLQKLMKMLKPGGYLQWGDANIAEYIFHTSAGTEQAPAARRLFESQQSIHSEALSNWKWLNTMESDFKSAGFEEVKFLRPPPKPSTLQPIMMDWLWALEESYKIVWERYPETRNLIEEGRRLREGPVMEEVRDLKVGLDLRMQRCIGRKPVNG